ncbi:hypothetical protein DL96DRAFT_1603428 [Flagelloscypha sp. PMI_526]|nr:hypothetical protein DL96DRAFT_1603428 [Flagelloscypha sp. PMI_526]
MLRANHVCSSLIRVHPRISLNDEYAGSLSGTMRRLKIFSLSSLALTTTMTPFLFIVESELPFMARCSLAATAMLTSGVGTGLVSWGAKSYVTKMRKTTGPEETLEFETSTMFLKKRVTRIYDPAFLTESDKPFPNGKLARSVNASSSQGEGEQETVAETLDDKGNVVGRWIVTWDGKGVGHCSKVGHVVGNFNIHQ